MGLSKRAKAAALLCWGVAGHAMAADCVNGINAAGSCTVPTGVTSMTFEVWGGGGGGGSRDKGWDGLPSSGSGGGGGSYCKATLAVSPGSSLVVQVAAGGTAGIANTNPERWHLPGTSSTGGGLSSVTGPGVVGVTANGGGGGGGSSVNLVYFDTARGRPGGGATAGSGGLGGAGGDGVLGPSPGAPGGGGGAGAQGGTGGTGGQGGAGAQGSDGPPWDGVTPGDGANGSDGSDGGNGGQGGPGGDGTIAGAGGAGGEAGFGGQGGLGGGGGPRPDYFDGEPGRSGVNGTPGIPGENGQTLSGPLLVTACTGDALAGMDGSGPHGGLAGGPEVGAGAGGEAGTAGQPGLVRMSFTVDQVPPTMPAQPTPVPTLGQWALMLLTMALAGLAAIRWRRT